MSQNLSFSEVNEEYWDGAAKNNHYDSKPWQKVMVKQIIADLRNHADWMGVDWAQKTETNGKTTAAPVDSRKGEIRLLDYACGLGVASEALLPYVTQIRGIDVSGNMVKEYNHRMEIRGERSEDVFAVQGNLLDATEPAALSDPDFFNFDIAIVNAALHHLDNPELAAQRLVKRLVPGKGVLIVSDFINLEEKPGHDEVSNSAQQVYHTLDYDKGHQHQHQASHTIAHKGFSKERMEQIFKDAGYTGFDYRRFEKPYKFGEKNDSFDIYGFIARGSRVEQ